MQSAERLTRQIAFLIECDRLKDIVRQTLNAHSGRPENDAEHSWALCLFVMTLAEHSNTPIDVLRVMKMLLIHDIVEIDAGDTFAYDAARLVDQHEREATAAIRLFGLLPDDQATEFRALWDEFEDRQTPDARFAHAIDRCQAMLLNCLSKGVTWSRHNVRLDQIRARNAPIGDGSAALWTHMSHLLDEAVQAGHITA
ncbi:MAG TPA: HD domain-containing protein [Vicinamibacterales bacterium]|nr:HD domain-containing protein [Vicinamibacterales bacterium]